VINIVDFGARADGDSVATAAFQKAIAAAAKTAEVLFMYRQGYIRPGRWN